MDEIKKEQAVTDAIVEKPIEFSIEYKIVKKVSEIERVKKTRFFFIPTYDEVEKEVEKEFIEREEFKVYTPSIGKLQLLSKLFLKLEIDFEFFKEDPSTALFKCCADKTDVMAEIMAVSIFRRKEDLLNTKLIREKAEFFKWHCNPQDFSIIIAAILTQIDLANFSNSIRLTKLFRLNVPKRNANGANRVENTAAAPSGVES